MDVFNLRNQVIAEYSRYVRSFLTIHDERIQDLVIEELEAGHLWPEPIVQLNPSFLPGPWMQELVDEGLLHPNCSNIFSDKSRGEPEPPPPLRLHAHQVDGVRAARAGDHYVLTTGTGSGKSLAYMVPIVDHVLRTGSGQGLKALVVYPMNALANSQLLELEKYLGPRTGRPPVTFHRYTGQEDSEARDAILSSPPDILLTNYVMLELMLTRPKERDLLEGAGALRFLVLDELHTYRGRQGADVAMLVRRVRETTGAKGLLHVGTSATLSTNETWEGQQAEVAEVATRIFGAEVKPERIIGETLLPVTHEFDRESPEVIQGLQDRIKDPSQLANRFVEVPFDPLYGWIERELCLYKEPGSGRLRRATPIPLRGSEGAAARLAAVTGLPEADCLAALQAALLQGNRLENDAGRPVFAFRLHQFLSKGESVYATPEPEADRHITLQAQRFAPDSGKTLALLPLAFCRECGQDYYSVRKLTDDRGRTIYLPRALSDMQVTDDGQPGYLLISDELAWPDPGSPELLERLPDDYIELSSKGPRVRRARRDRVPSPVFLSGLAEEGQGDQKAHFIRAPFHFCARCGVVYNVRMRSDFGKLATLGSEGRSTATTILSLAAVRQLREQPGLDPTARKLLSFTDNRQDASLQAGHFNDFVEIALVRSALYRAAAQAGDEGIRHEALPLRVFESLHLERRLYAVNPEARFAQGAETDRALREVLGYNLYRDLTRGWRVTSPNLEQCGLLHIDYASLDELAEAEDIWGACHPALATANPADRAKVCRALLDFLRRELAIRVDYLDPVRQEQILQLSGQYLVEPWAINELEKLETSRIVFPRASGGDDTQGGRYLFLSPRGGIGHYLKDSDTFPAIDEKLSTEDVAQILLQVLQGLHQAGLVTQVREPRCEEDVPGFQVEASGMIWRAGTGQRAYNDPVRVPNQPEEGHRTNPFFLDLYRSDTSNLQALESREHTAQVLATLREERERRFRSADLPVMFCSPTMELGVDIRELNVVSLRNVPPTPANYAQRSGRAGRGGQPAFIYTYCSSGSPHDKYFFQRSGQMVAGAVSPPRLDLGNEDLVRAHVHAIWLREARLDLCSNLTDLLDVAGTEPSLALQPHVLDALRDTQAKAKARQRALGALRPALEEVVGTEEGRVEAWLDDILERLPRAFQEACERWRHLYRSAMGQRRRQFDIQGDLSRPPEDRKRAGRLISEANRQLDLLRNAGSDNQFSDFYSYRYFASEGFLPGYSFPRLPLNAFLPGRRRRTNQEEFVSRPRFLAISEFGPRAFLYHEGARYEVNQVILPVDEGAGILSRASWCDRCSYVHPLRDEPGPDLCEHCGSRLPLARDNLFRMRHVSTRRRDRINSDEEERLRLGYEIRTGIRFAQREGRRDERRATLRGSDGNVLATLVYGHTATIRRVNLGWRRRSNKDELGYLLDIERGYWCGKGRSQSLTDSSKGDDQKTGDETEWSRRITRVIPYVEDVRNCLLLEPAGAPEVAIFASLAAALKMAIQAEFQIEDSELAAEALPSNDSPHTYLLYESSEGGAGVLRNLVEDPGCLPRLARRALEVCHYDPDTLEDVERSPRATERCEAACYDCLLSYYNQRDHRFLDRTLLRELLRDWRDGSVEIAAAPAPRVVEFANLLDQARSDLERRWLNQLRDLGLRLPNQVHALASPTRIEADFLYDQVAVFIDDEAHDTAEARAVDEESVEELMDQGFSVVRFRHDADWEALFRRYPGVFGEIQERAAGTTPLPDPEPGGDLEGLDLDLFDEGWHPFLRTLAEHEGIVVDGGGDFHEGDGKVLGAFEASISRAERTLYLLDGEDPDHDRMATLMSRAGYPHLVVGPAKADVAERVLELLERSAP